MPKRWSRPGYRAVTNPWNGPRHQSWASNTMLSFLLLVICIIAVGISDHFGEPPNYLVGLLGTAAGTFFAAIGSDKQKRDVDTRQSAERAETRADLADRRADAAEERESRSGGSQHNDDHTEGDGGHQ